jgi:hypothetical protein
MMVEGIPGRSSRVETCDISVDVDKCELSVFSMRYQY